MVRLEELEAELARVRGDLARQDRLATIGLLAAGVAHEVNNLLTPALGSAQMLERMRDPASRARSLERIEEGIRDAARVLSALLDFARPAPGGEPTPCTTVAEAWAAALRCLPRSLESDGIALHVDLAGLPALAIDGLELQQVLLNLLLNAQRALRDSRAPRIELRGRVVGERVELHVADNGPGVPKEIAPRLFEPFVAGPARPGERRTGLGLSICRRTLERVGGTIEHDSANSGGACFVVSIPVAASAQTWRCAG